LIGGEDIFNNAGIAVGGEVRDMTMDDWHAVLDVNLNGVEKNKPLIVVTALAKIFWWLYRISPGLIIALQKSSLKKAREEVRIDG